VKAEIHSTIFTKDLFGFAQFKL